MAGSLADLLHRLVAVHLGHHDVDQGDVDARRLLEDQDAVPARARHAALRRRSSRARWSASRCCGCRHRRSGSWRRRARAACAACPATSLARPGAPPPLAGHRPARASGRNTSASSSSSAGFPVTPNAPISVTEPSLVGAGDDVDRDVARSRDRACSRSSSTKPSMSARPRSSVIASGCSLRAMRQRARAGGRDARPSARRRGRGRAGSRRRSGRPRRSARTDRCRDCRGRR